MFGFFFVVCLNLASKRTIKHASQEMWTIKNKNNNSILDGKKINSQDDVDDFIAEFYKRECNDGKNDIKDPDECKGYYDEAVAAGSPEDFKTAYRTLESKCTGTHCRKPCYTKIAEFDLREKTDWKEKQTLVKKNCDPNYGFLRAINSNIFLVISLLIGIVSIFSR